MGVGGQREGVCVLVPCFNRCQVGVYSQNISFPKAIAMIFVPCSCLHPSQVFVARVKLCVN